MMRMFKKELTKPHLQKSDRIIASTIGAGTLGKVSQRGAKSR